MYSVYALLCHLPRVLIRAFDIPACEVDRCRRSNSEAMSCILGCRNAPSFQCNSQFCDKAFPSQKLSIFKPEQRASSPSLNERYPKTAESGLKSIPVLPRCRDTPFERGLS